MCGSEFKCLPNLSESYLPKAVENGGIIIEQQIKDCVTGWESVCSDDNSTPLAWV